jgi:GT2 family glycosyltransferase
VSAQPLVSTIVVAFGKEAQLERCLRSIAAALAAVDGATESIVVLNQVSDEERQTIGEEGRIIVDPGRNLGFAGGVAAGLAEARGEWIALINDDCLVDEGAVVAMLAAGRTAPDIGSVAAQIRFAGRPDTLNSAGLEIDQLGIAYERLLGKPASVSTDVEEVFGASAAAALYRRTMLEAVGGFDTSFFAYLEDADLAWRARMAGWRCVYAPGAIVLHDHSSSLGHRSAEKYFLVGRNRVRMLAKNATRTLLLRRSLAMLTYDLAYIVYAGGRARSFAPLRGRIDGLREWRFYRAEGRPQRRPIQLTQTPGFRSALRRDRDYRRTHRPEARFGRSVSADVACERAPAGQRPTLPEPPGTEEKWAGNDVGDEIDRVKDKGV